MAMLKKAIVVHSGGMDSSLCLWLAMLEHGKDNVLSLSFRYGQRHSAELEKAHRLCRQWEVHHQVIDIPYLRGLTNNALLDPTLEIQSGEQLNTLVVGRNGLFAHLAAIYAHTLGASEIYLGVIEIEEANSGYRDCSRDYMDLMQKILRLDLANPQFTIKTPLVFMTKKATMELAFDQKILKDLLEETISCYEGIEDHGCGRCPACLLRNQGVQEFLNDHPDFDFSYRHQFT